ncbi:MAG: TerC family protein [Planctomycetes bacterium]|nr:TerC family protein [Planctomycetota bacterium]
MLALDLGVFHRREHEVRMREALIWSFVWIALALLFNLWIYHEFGAVKGLEFLTGYLLEKAMSVDNLFVFLVIFTYFAVPKSFQHRVLFWGVLGALGMRAAFIFVGLALIQMFDWVILVLGLVLLVTGVKMLRHQGVQVQPEQNPVLRFFRRFVPVTAEYHGTHFTVVTDGHRFATPLALVLIVIETTDLAFAIDSIPAIIGITTDPFIVFTSNIFAILGLRALYFVLAGLMDKFHYLSVGLGLTLVFIAVKMLIHDWVPIPVSLSLGVIGLFVGGAMVVSLLKPQPTNKAAKNAEPA